LRNYPWGKEFTKRNREKIWGKLLGMGWSDLRKGMEISNPQGTTAKKAAGLGGGARKA